MYLQNNDRDTLMSRLFFLYGLLSNIDRYQQNEFHLRTNDSYRLILENDKTFVEHDIIKPVKFR